MTAYGASSIAFVIVILLLIGLFVPGLVRYFWHKNRLDNAKIMQEAIIHVANECVEKSQEAVSTPKPVAAGEAGQQARQENINMHSKAGAQQYFDDRVRVWQRSRLRGARVGFFVCLCAIVCAVLAAALWYFAISELIVYLLLGIFAVLLLGVGFLIIVRVNLVYARKKKYSKDMHSAGL